MINVTEQLARFIVDTEYKNIPRDAVTKAKELLIDTVGVTLAGSAQPLSRIMLDHVKDMGGTPECTVFGKGHRTSATNAALINGTMAHALDYDDACEFDCDSSRTAGLPNRNRVRFRVRNRQPTESITIAIAIPIAIARAPAASPIGIGFGFGFVIDSPRDRLRLRLRSRLR